MNNLTFKDSLREFFDENSVSAKIAHTAKDGKSYKIKFHNLDAIFDREIKKILKNTQGN
jgi:hypothetical protein